MKNTNQPVCKQNLHRTTSKSKLNRFNFMVKSVNLNTCELFLL